MEKVLDFAKCCGCSVCVLKCPRQCITMEENAEGFFYPIINTDLCIDCMLCQKLCPVINHTIQQGNPRVYAALNRNVSVREISSSGGVFYALANKMIQNKGVVCAARFNYTTYDVEHDFIDETNIHELEEFCGSKYVESALNDSFEKIEVYLKEKRPVLFVGSPCQVAALKTYVKDDSLLICCDFICHGVPSRKVLKKYLNSQQKSIGERIQKLKFRGKEKGWKLYSMCIKTDKKIYSADYNKDPYLRAFRADMDLKPACYQCVFKSIRQESDITLGDFWGIRKYIKNVDDYQGVSYVAVQSQKGHDYFEQIKDDLNIYEMNPEIIYQPALVKAAECPDNREYFMVKLEDTDFSELVNLMLPLNRKKGITDNLRWYVDAMRKNIR